MRGHHGPICLKQYEHKNAEMRIEERAPSFFKKTPLQTVRLNSGGVTLAQSEW